MIEDTQKTRLIKRIEDAFGVDVITALQDAKTVEVMLNPDGVLWHERLGEPMKKIGKLKSSSAEAAIKAVAAFHDVICNAEKPILENKLPIYKARFTGWLPPFVNAPSFSIRKHASIVYPLANYVEECIMTQEQCNIIKGAVKAKNNIIVVGGTLSGKTTLMNALIHEKVCINPFERIFIIEDTGEVQCSAENCVQFGATQTLDMMDAVRTTMRGRPDSIIIGEVRGAEALNLLDAWNSGHHGGICSIHANSSSEGIYKLISYVTRNKFSPRNIEPLIVGAVQLLVFIHKTETSRKVAEILEIKGYENGKFLTNKL